MYSPLYIAEQKALYPHRIMVIDYDGAQQIADHMKHLIEINADTLEKMSKTPLGELQYKYFTNGSTWQILDAFKLLKH